MTHSGLRIDLIIQNFKQKKTYFSVAVAVKPTKGTPGRRERKTSNFL